MAHERIPRGPLRLFFKTLGVRLTEPVFTRTSPCPRCVRTTHATECRGGGEIDHRFYDTTGSALLDCPADTRFRRASRQSAAVLICVFQPGAPAEPIQVRHIEKTIHGFLALRTKEGHVLAVGDLFQVVRGDRLTSRLLIRFKDGSVGDGTAVFSQRGNFQLITDRHIQKGPSFPHRLCMLVIFSQRLEKVKSVESV